MGRSRAFLTGVEIVLCPSLAVSRSSMSTPLSASPASCVAAAVNRSDKGALRRPSSECLLSRLALLSSSSWIFTFVSRSLYLCSRTVSKPSSSHLTLGQEPDDALEFPELVDIGRKLETVDIADPVRGRPINVANSTDSRSWSDDALASMTVDDAVDPLRTLGNRIDEGKPSPRILFFFLTCTGLIGSVPASKLLDELRRFDSFDSFAVLVFFPFFSLFVAVASFSFPFSFLMGTLSLGNGGTSSGLWFRLPMRAMDRTERIARRAIEPWCCPAS